MAVLGYALSAEEHGPSDLVRFAALGEETGFPTAWVSDHYHPWVDAQGQSPFVWSVLGGIASVTTSLRVGTGVTCPTMRIHPAVVAQAAATTAAMFGGRFFFGVGTGEALNEHILGDRWPEADVRLEMLEEAVELMRELWRGGNVSHDGTHYLVENARLYTLPDEPPLVIVSGFGPKAIELAARIGDGYVATSTDAEMVEQYRSQGGTGPCMSSLKVCWGADEAAARKLAHELWPNSGLPGELAQILPTPAHFEQAATLVTEEAATESMAIGPDPEVHVAALQEYLDAGWDEVYVQQIGPDQQGFCDFYRTEVFPRLSL
jgi:G6PDH family F420-dependent oxidoreductase